MGRGLNRRQRRDLEFGRAIEDERGKLVYIDVQATKQPEITLKPKNDKQRNLLISLIGDPCVIVTGPAGSGKTYVTAGKAAQELKDKRIKKIILSRPNIGTGKSLGAFPGTVEEKMAPWLLAITDVLREFLGDSMYKHCLKSGAIEIQPMETIRGRSYPNCWVLFDEAQNLTNDELKAIVTRQGENSTMVLMGDRTQRDTNTDGLRWLKDIAEKYKVEASFHEFDSDDIVRSGMCKQWVKAFEGEMNDNDSI